MTSVLFVCLGNICRSPMAEAVFRHLAEQEGLAGDISIDSAGIGGWHAGEPPHKGTQKVLTEKGIACDTLRARQITRNDFAEYDYVVCMDDENLAALMKMAPAGKKVYRLLDFAHAVQEQNVEDPYYTGRFSYVYDLVEAGCRGLLAEIKRKKG
ncbi:phosphotyrosine protein phosphatase [Brevibacillus agri]|uniref:protein-tyrosine-phosphatase n=1 Tax=Brevibacillus agri TaxID=51101 RepID=A0A3M8B2C5_9BACL|nr:MULTISPECIES: low molecular weight protein-tyrosine-phosphatase [Brevibacillus]ELK42269.1 low molecular weight protein-tyrosine-phosphatase [Brevibacillus agri BAB-2500]MBY0052044.1 low molecular weight phosphotyrosine protein phosphatase [Brevibacillus agri]MED1644547.1 low molecular weight phosphotyrosine protein phosphatase [Brevibacillus agri]MED1654836.1 low molecular weight phosphotyrosine protein phosphatase [Brevibacillus agri]MED1687566.1 low molecular weight phosphotyrosine protei